MPPIFAQVRFRSNRDATGLEASTLTRFCHALTLQEH